MGLDDEGPTTYDSSLAALGSCTSKTVAPYAQRIDPPIQGITARLLHTRIWGYATDCGENVRSRKGRSTESGWVSLWGEA